MAVSKVSPASSELTFKDLKNNRFLEIMSLSMQEIYYMDEYEKTELRKEINTLRKYFAQRNLPLTPLFLSSVNGKIGAINSKLATLGY